MGQKPTSNYSLFVFFGVFFLNAATSMKIGSCTGFSEKQYSNKIPKTLQNKILLKKPLSDYPALPGPKASQPLPAAARVGGGQSSGSQKVKYPWFLRKV